MDSTWIAFREKRGITHLDIYRRQSSFRQLALSICWKGDIKHKKVRFLWVHEFITLQRCSLLAHFFFWAVLMWFSYYFVWIWVPILLPCNLVSNFESNSLKICLDKKQLTVRYFALIWLIFGHSSAVASLDKFVTCFNSFSILLYSSETFL